MDWFFILLFIATCIALGILYHRYDLMKAYYKYQTDALERMERRYDKDLGVSEQKVNELQTIAFMNATTNI